MLTKFKSSEVAREREVYTCMIHNLFDEYQFFHKYPLKELRITGVLFGLLVQHKLVSQYTLGTSPPPLSISISIPSVAPHLLVCSVLLSTDDLCVLCVVMCGA